MGPTKTNGGRPMPNMRVGLVIDWETVCVYYGSSYWDVIEHRSNCVSLR